MGGKIGSRLNITEDGHPPYFNCVSLDLNLLERLPFDVFNDWRLIGVAQSHQQWIAEAPQARDICVSCTGRDDPTASYLALQL